MTERYRHTQFGRIGLMLVGILSVLMLVALLSVPAPAPVILAMLALLVGLGAVFTSLTTVVTDRAFVHHFGLGVWRKEYPLADILSVEPVRNRWWYGLGIRLTPHGWLYNVWGLDAVEVRLATGRTFRVGTDEPRVLAERIRTAKLDLPAASERR